MKKKIWEYWLEGYKARNENYEKDTNPYMHDVLLKSCWNQGWLMNKKPTLKHMFHLGLIKVDDIDFFIKTYPNYSNEKFCDYLGFSEHEYLDYINHKILPIWIKS